MRRIAMTLSIALCMLLSTQDAGADPANTSSAAGMERFIDDQALLVVHIDLAAIDFAATSSELQKLFEALSLGDDSGAGQLVASIRGAQALPSAGIKDLYLIVSGADFPWPRLIVATLPTDPQAASSAMTTFKSVMPTANALNQIERVGNAIVSGSPAAIERLRSTPPAVRSEVAAALAAAGPSAIQILAIPTSSARRVVDELLPTLPEMVGGGSSRVWTQGVEWAVVAVDLPPQKLGARLIVKSPNAEAATALHQGVKRVITAGAKLPGIDEIVPNYDEMQRLLTPEVAGDRVTLDLTTQNGRLPAAVKLLSGPMKMARVSAERARTTNQLKQFGLAMHNYLSTQKSFPPRGKSADGKSQLSWRVHLLPYLEQGGGEIYKEFHLDEPWDSEHNRKLIDRMPAIYRSALSPNVGAGRTTFLVPVLPGGIYRDGEPPLSTRDITDGLSNTILMVDADADHAVVWTRPDDFEVDLADPAKGLRNEQAKGFCVLMADGSVRFFGNDVSKEGLKMLFTANGAEPVDPNNLK